MRKYKWLFVDILEAATVVVALTALTAHVGCMAVVVTAPTADTQHDQPVATTMADAGTNTATHR